MQWLDVSGVKLPTSDKSAYRFKVTKEDEAELEEFIKCKGRGRARRDALLRAPGRIGVGIGSGKSLEGTLEEGEGEGGDGMIEIRK